MFDLIRKKAEELRSLNPSNYEYKVWLDRSNLWYWLYFDMSLRGIRVTPRQIADVLDGQILESCPMEVYSYVHGFADVFDNMKSNIIMKNSLTPRMLDEWCGELFDPKDRDGNPLPVRRVSTSAVYEWGHIPPHFHDIPALLSGLLSACSREHYSGNYLDRILDIYIEILRIYPYGEYSVSAAGMAFIYGLMEEGLPVPGIALSETEYNTLVAECMEHGNSAPLRDALSRNIYNRLDEVYQAALAAEAHNTEN